MVVRFDVEAVAASARSGMAEMAANSVRPVAKSAYRANEVYVQMIRWAATECNQMAPGDDATDAFRAASMVIAQQILGVANLITSPEKAQYAAEFMLTEVGELMSLALSGQVKSRSFATPIVDVGDA